MCRLAYFADCSSQGFTDICISTHTHTHASMHNDFCVKWLFYGGLYCASAFYCQWVVCSCFSLAVYCCLLAVVCLFVGWCLLVWRGLRPNRPRLPGKQSLVHAGRCESEDCVDAQDRYVCGRGVFCVSLMSTPARLSIVYCTLCVWICVISLCLSTYTHILFLCAVASRPSMAKLSDPTSSSSSSPSSSSSSSSSTKSNSKKKRSKKKRSHKKKKKAEKQTDSAQSSSAKSDSTSASSSSSSSSSPSSSSSSPPPQIGGGG